MENHEFLSVYLVWWRLDPTGEYPNVTPGAKCFTVVVAYTPEDALGLVDHLLGLAGDEVIRPLGLAGDRPRGHILDATDHYQLLARRVLEEE